MKILAIETSTLLGSVAIVEDERILCELTLQVEETHSAQLLPAVESMFQVTGTRPEEMDGFAIAAGPGSFTGLRIGMAAVKGLAVAASKPVIGISTLEAMAWEFPFSRYPLLPMIDARMKEVYGASFQAQAGEIIRLSKDMVLPPSEFLKELREPVILFGSGALRYHEEISKTVGKNALFPPQEIMGARASIVGMLAMRRLKNGDIDDLDSLEPVYIRQAQAIEGRKKHAGS